MSCLHKAVTIITNLNKWACEGKNLRTLTAIVLLQYRFDDYSALFDFVRRAIPDYEASKIAYIENGGELESYTKKTREEHLAELYEEMNESDGSVFWRKN